MTDLMKTPGNATELRDHLCETFKQLSSGQINVKVACELSNMAGKISGTTKMQLEYAKLRKEKPDIPFLK